MPATWLDDPEQWWARGEHAWLMADLAWRSASSSGPALPGVSPSPTPPAAGPRDCGE
jgi:hypothetical protein